MSASFGYPTNDPNPGRSLNTSYRLYLSFRMGDLPNIIDQREHYPTIPYRHVP